ncbi:MAG: fold metallo-hydrolase [Marmoricola sp.]|nr:fold metallo-hydrolase [Marmoricola sp.]
MHVVTLEVSHLGNRTHLVHDGAVAVVIDPPRDLGLVERAAVAAEVEIVAVAETHLHNDYVSGGLELSQRHHAHYLVSADEDVEFHRVGVRDHETLAYGNLDLLAIATPGHTPHHLSYLALDSHLDAPGALFSGGSLLHGGVGRTDLVDPSLTTALTRAQWLSARRLGALPAETPLYPTHGFGSFCSSGPATAADGPVTVGDQHRINPALTSTRDAFVDSLLAGLGPVPAHYPHMAPRNLRGAWTPRPATRIRTADLERALAGGAQVVDLRSRDSYAAAHLPGSIGVEHGTQSAVYAAWVTPWGAELVLVSDSEADLDRTEQQLASIGIEGVSTAVIDLADPALGWTGHRRVDWAGFVAAEPVPGRVLLDVRTPEEWRAGHLPDALNIPVHELPQRLGEVPDGQVWVHCQAGFRAGIAASLLDRAERDVVLTDDDFAAVERLRIPVRRSRTAA